MLSGQEIHCKIQKCLAGGTYRNACSVCRTGKKARIWHSPKKLEQGEVIPVVSAEKKQGFTSPPKAFTEDTLLSAMESAGNKEFEKRHGKRKDWEHLRPVQRFWKSWYLPAMWNAKASRFFPVQRGLRQSQISRIT